MNPLRPACAALGGLLLALSTPTAAPAQSRTPFVVDEITAANASLAADVRAEKYALMKESAFAFYRGTNHLYWKDLGTSPLLATYGGTSTTRTWLAGDMHVDNTGAFDDDQGDVVFGLNDFDEAVIGDYQLDVWRLATSLLLVARANGGFNAADQEVLVDAFSEAYLDTLADFVGNDGAASRKFRASNTYGLLNNFLKDVTSGGSRSKLLNKWTVKVQGSRQLDTSNNEDLAPVSSAVDADLRARMADYRASLSGGGTFSSGYFTVKSVARRLHAGLGSLGVARYYVLIEGATSSQDDDRLLDVKAQRAPSAWPYLDPAALNQTSAACAGHMAVRTVLAYKALGYRVDDHLGWMSLADGAPYSVREVSPWKKTFDTTRLDTLTRFMNLAEQWGQVLATHHARADQDGNLEGEVHSRTDGDHAGFRARVRAVALDYSNQARADYESFRAHF
ncbi:MAG: DUF2252 family protein [Cystobacter sp.]